MPGKFCSGRRPHRSPGHLYARTDSTRGGHLCVISIFVFACESTGVSAVVVDEVFPADSHTFFARSSGRVVEWQ